MPDLDLPDLAAEIAERTHPPRFDAVLARARRQRRLQYAVAGVVAAVVVGTGAGVAGLVERDRSEPSPAPPPPTSESEEAARLIADAKAVPVATSVSEDGGIAVLWQSVTSVGSAFALRVGDGTDTIGMVPNGATDLIAVPGGWLVAETPGGEQQVLFLTPDGTLSAVRSTDRVTTPGVDDRVLVVGGEVWVYSTEERRLLRTPPLPDNLSLLPDSDVTSLGRVVASCASHTPGDRSAGRCVLDGDTWTYTPQAGGKVAYPGIVASYGEHVAVTTFRGTTPYVLGSLTLLDGEQATDVDLASYDLGRVFSMAVLEDGYVLIADVKGRLTGVTPDGEVQPTDADGFIRLTSTGDRVWATSLDRRGPLSYSDDRGRTWQETPMPGLP